MSVAAYTLKQVRRGDKLERTFRFFDADRKPVDVSALEFRFVVAARGAILFDLTTTTGQLSRPAPHEVHVALSGEQTARLKPGGVQSYELRIEDFEEAVMFGSIEGVDGLGALL